MGETKRYESIDILRTIACFGIIMMHIALNSNYQINDFFYNEVVGRCGNFIYLFMVISAFCLCAGYLDRFLNNTVSISDFYRRRFSKIWPFFACLVFIDLLVAPSKASFYQAFADLTLLFGLLPGTVPIEVIGVGWFLGTVFVFYLIFPFFCCLLENNRRAWTVFVLSIFMNYACAHYFEAGIPNILFSLCFFLVGGLVYLYRERLEKINIWVALFITAVSLVGFYYGNSILFAMLVSVALLVDALIFKKSCRFFKFFSSLSLELYLSHMFIFRMLEKLNLTKFFGSGRGGYCLVVLLTILGSMVFALGFKCVMAWFKSRFLLKTGV